MGAQDKFEMVSGGGGEVVGEIGKDRGELWKYRGGILGQRFSLRQ